MVTKNEGWVEEHFNDPRMVEWGNVVEGLRIMGLDMRDDGKHVIEVEISVDHLVIKRCRRGIGEIITSDSGHEYKDDAALWSVTKDILMRPRRE